MTDTPPDFDRGVPSPARMYDYYLGGKDNFPADREAAEEVIASHPQQVLLARNNRAFLHRAVEFVTAQGVDQFVDVGTGIPTSPNVHEIARAAHPRARVAYVDNDPVVLAHDRALLAADGDVAVVEGDMLDPEGILADDGLRAVIDFDRPVGLLFVSVLHFSRERAPAELVAPFVERLVPGSYLAVSHGTTEGLSAEEKAALEQAYAATPGGVRLRSAAEIAAAFTGFSLVEPGLVDVSQWRGGFEPPTHVQILAGVGRRT